MLTILTVSPLAFWLTRDTIDGLSESVARRQNKAATERRNDAEKALAQFSSITASRYGVAQTGSGGVAPMLFLPCPDNLGDKNLDGAADAPCGADAGGDNLTNGALNSGSRFGRFPWRVRVTAEGGGGSISRFDFGFGADLRDAYGNRAWYAISKNIASHKSNAAPLYNFHHLHWRDKSRWLSLYDARGLLADDVAAVVLFPGQPLGDQIRDPIYENARAAISVAVSAAAYFESMTARISATVWATISNADNDGRFVVAPAAADFNDEIALLRLSEMTAPSSPHYDAYIGLVGAPRDKTHNAPVAGSLLAGFAREVEDFYRAFRYYPHPAIDAVALTIENGLAGDCGDAPNSISIHTIGFWPDQEYPAMKLARSGSKMTASVDLRGGFLHRGVLFESGNTITIFPGDDIIVESGDYFRVEANVDKLSTRYLFDKIIVISNDESFAATMTTTLTNVRTDARTYREAGFFLHATVTITASTPDFDNDGRSVSLAFRRVIFASRSNQISAMSGSAQFYKRANRGLRAQSSFDLRGGGDHHRRRLDRRDCARCASRVADGADLNKQFHFHFARRTNFPRRAYRCRSAHQRRKYHFSSTIDSQRDYPFDRCRCLSRSRGDDDDSQFARAVVFDHRARAGANSPAEKSRINRRREIDRAARRDCEGRGEFEIRRRARPCDLESGAARLGRLPAAKRGRRPRQSNPNRICDRLNFERYAPARIGRGRDLPRFVSLA